eukprot:1102411-Rhodomonas_salina.1
MRYLSTRRQYRTPRRTIGGYPEKLILLFVEALAAPYATSEPDIPVLAQYRTSRSLYAISRVANAISGPHIVYPVRYPSTEHRVCRQRPAYAISVPDVA